uniref:Nuclear export factor 4 n=1 Tax=Drosophila melanogaster TaxID=7227 RepID=Q8INS6_DROME|nr:nuclear export factor 4 [Drosophila melanogaster]AAN13351.1 nuclear export factor 4 [Drosophila melanogaster]|eukprot:NP_731156.1 nuclear export factor 4 [Drosophila melanogaster]
MFATPRNNSSEGPLCHSTPRSVKGDFKFESKNGARLPRSIYGWYRVLIYSTDRRLTFNRVLRRIRCILTPLKINPRYKHTGGEQDTAEDSWALFTFFVDSYDVASALFRRGWVDNQIWLKVSDRMPKIWINSILRLHLTMVLLDRYDPVERSLDLTLFYKDKALCGEFFALAESNCMSTVLGIVDREMPELERLILDGNHLTNLWVFRKVERRFPRLHSISLKHNDIENIYSLRNLQFLPLAELNLLDNPLPAGYEKEVLDIWPSLQVLNKIQVTPDPAMMQLVERVLQHTGTKREFFRFF